MSFRRVLTSSVFLVLSLYFVVAVGVSVYLLLSAFRDESDQIDQRTIAALIAVIGVGLTTLTALYTATRQSASSHELAVFQASIDKEIQKLQAASQDSLERLKAYLDSGKDAYRELSGAASFYFYALRSSALLGWDDITLQKAETRMIEATRQIIYVSDGVRDRWFDFWQEAQTIYREAIILPDDDGREDALNTRIGEVIQDGNVRANLRTRLSRVMTAAREAVQTEFAHH